NVAIFDLDFDDMLAAMYAVNDSAEGDSYLSVPPDPGIEAAALGASASAAPRTGESTAPGAGESALSGNAPTEALHTFTLDSGASRSFFHDSTTLTPLSRPVAISLADPSGGPVLAHSSTVLPCPAAPSGLLSGLKLPSFSTNLVSGADLQNAWVDQFTPGGQRVTHCTCSRTGRHLATFTRRPGSSLYTLTTASPPVTASGQVATSGQVFAAASRSSPASAPCSCLMASGILVSGLPRSLPPLPPGPAPTCVPCVEGRQRAAPHSSDFPRIEAPLQTLHMDVWGSARVRRQGHERYFLLVVDDYSRYTTVFPLRQKGETEVRRIGMIMDVARTSMIHAAAPHFMWLFAVQYTAHQINLQPRVSLPETTPILLWTGKVGDASVFHVWGSRAFVRDTFTDKLSSRADVEFDESVSYYRVSQVDPAELVEVAVDSGAARGAEPAGTGTWGSEPGGAEPERVEPGGAESWSVEPGGAEPERVEPGGAELGWEPLSLQQLREWYARRCRGSAGAGGAAGAAGGAAGAGAARGAFGAAGGAAGAGAARGAAGGAAGGTGTVGGPAGVAAAGGAGAAGPRGARTGGTGAAGAGGATGVGAAGAGAVATGGASGAGDVGGTGAGGAAGVVARDPGAEGTGVVSIVSGGAARPRPYYVPLLQQVVGLPPSPGPTPLPSPLPVQSQSQLELSSAASALVPELVDFPAACRLDYATCLIAESASASVCPPSVGGLCALGTDVLEDRQEEFECFAAAITHLVYMLLAPEGDPDAPDIPTPRSCAEAIEGPYSSQWQAAMDVEMASWKSTGTYVDEVPPPGANIVSGMWIFRVKRPPGSLPFFKARYVSRGFSHRAFLQGSLHEEIWLRRPLGFTESFPAGTQWSLRRLVYGLRQARREWHDTVRTTLAALGFAPSTADPSLFLRTDTTLPPFYVLVYVDDLVFTTADTEALAHVNSSCEAEIYAGPSLHWSYVGSPTC
ncbi:unnamed protein product, partial [Closterium sp. NIES-53]